MSSGVTDLYDVLGVTSAASPYQLKIAYRNLMRQLHPDLHPNQDPERFYQTTQAYQILSDPLRRQSYDRMLGRHVAAQPSPDSAQNSAQGTTSQAEPMSNRLGDRGRDLNIELTITLHESATGVSESIQVSGWELCQECFGSGNTPTDHTLCLRCNGAGVVSGYRDVTVVLPAGVRAGESFRLLGQGNTGRHGALPGDLVVTVRVNPHPLFTRDGNDLLLDVPVSPAEAILGKTVLVPTVTDHVMLRLPPGIQHGTQLRVRDQGFVSPYGRGSLLVTVHIVIPTDGETNKKLRKATEALYQAQPDPEAGLRAGLHALAQPLPLVGQRSTKLR